MFDGLETIWLDGALVPEAEATTHMLSHSLHYGSGVFEGVRCYPAEGGPAIFRLDDHVRRLLKSAAVVGLEPAYDAAALADACVAVVAANGLDSAYLRPLIFFGRDTLGVPPRRCPTRVMIAAWRWGRYVAAESPRIQVSDVIRIHPGSLDPEAKVCGHYVNSLLAVRKAHAAGYDEALLLDHEGYVAECSGENVFAVKDGVIFTPPRGNILPGITRDTAIELAAREGWEVREEPFRLGFLTGADEAFMTGTAAEVTPMSEVGGVTLTAGAGPVTARIRDRYQDLVHGRLEGFEHFLRRVAPGAG